MSEVGKIDIPVTWVEEKIKEHPGMYGVAWSYLLYLWDKHVHEARLPPVEKDDYVRMHKDQTAAQKFWRNE